MKKKKKLKKNGGKSFPIVDLFFLLSIWSQHPITDRSHSQQQSQQPQIELRLHHFHTSILEILPCGSILLLLLPFILSIFQWLSLDRCNTNSLELKKNGKPRKRKRMSDQFKHPRIVTWSVDSVTPTVEDITSHGPDSSFSLSSWSGSIVLLWDRVEELERGLEVESAAAGSVLDLHWSARRSQMD